MVFWVHFCPNYNTRKLKEIDHHDSNLQKFFHFGDLDCILESLGFEKTRKIASICESFPRRCGQNNTAIGLGRDREGSPCWFHESSLH